MKVYIFFFIVFLELALTFYFGNKLYQHHISLSANVFPLRREELVFPKESSLRYFYEPKPNTLPGDKIAWPPYGVTYRVNADSLIDRFAYSTKKDRDVFRIITLGDSFTSGLFVKTKDNYTEILEDLLNETLSCKNFKTVEVINLAVPGYDISYAAERFRLRGQKYDPDLVLWLLIENDFYDNQEALQALADRMQKSQEGKRPWFGERGQPSYIWNAFRASYSEKVALQDAFQALSQLNRYYNKSLVIFSSPIFFSSEERHQKASSLLGEFLKERRGIYFFENLRDIYSLGGAPLSFDLHPNKIGHEIIARDLLRYLRENSVIPCE